ncbi:MAG: glycine cleavage system protein GcvH [Polyangiaceae bacterium]
MSAAKEVRTDRHYTKDHEWAKVTDGEILVGISAFAVDQLGDITLVDLTVKPGDELSAHQVFGTIESVKTLSDLFCPVAGRVTRINEALTNNPEWVNEDCWEKSWMIAIESNEPLAHADGLLAPDAYAGHLDASDH